MYERFTDRARKVMQLANQEAQRFNHEYIGTEHILLGLVKEGSGVAANVLKNLDVDLRKIRIEVEKIVQTGPDMVTMGKLPQTPRAKKVIEYAMEEARNLNHNYVGTEHLLLGLLREQEGVAAQVLMNLGMKLDDVRDEVLNLLGHPLEGGEAAGTGERPEGGSQRSSRSKTPALDSFGRDLTELLVRKNSILSLVVNAKLNASFRYFVVARRITRFCLVKRALVRPRSSKALLRWLWMGLSQICWLTDESLFWTSP